MDKRLLDSLVRGADFSDRANRLVLADALDENDHQPVASRYLRSDHPAHHRLAQLALTHDAPLREMQTWEGALNMIGPTRRSTRLVWVGAHPETGYLSTPTLRAKLHSIYAYLNATGGRPAAILEYRPHPRKPEPTAIPPGYRDSGEGPFATRQSARNFAHAEVGVPHRIIRSADGYRIAVRHEE